MNNTTQEFLKPEFAATMNGLETLVRAVEYCLLISGKRGNQYLDPDRNKGLSARDLFSMVRSEFVDCEGLQEMPWNTFKSYLSQESNNSASEYGSKIRTARKKAGYFYGDFSSFVSEADGDIEADTQQEQTEDVTKGKAQRESRLYDILVNWLKKKKYQARNISSGKRGDRWGNPDVAGVAVTSLLGVNSVELVTIEAKTSVKDWAQQIFEAVAHRKFANRSYFAFATTDDEISDDALMDELKYTAELYGIGLVAIVLERSAMNSLLTMSVDELKNFQFDPEEYEVKEIHRAPHFSVPPKRQQKFFGNHKIDSLESLMGWCIASDLA